MWTTLPSCNVVIGIPYCELPFELAVPFHCFKNIKHRLSWPLHLPLLGWALVHSRSWLWTWLFWISHSILLPGLTYRIIEVMPICDELTMLNLINMLIWRRTTLIPDGANEHVDWLHDQVWPLSIYGPNKYWPIIDVAGPILLLIPANNQGLMLCLPEI